MSPWVWIDTIVIACTVANITIVVRDWRKRRQPPPPITPGSEATVAELTRRNLWQADQIEKLSRQLSQKEADLWALQHRLEQLGVGKDGRGDD